MWLVCSDFSQAPKTGRIGAVSPGGCWSCGGKDGSPSRVESSRARSTSESVQPGIFSSSLASNPVTVSLPTHLARALRAAGAAVPAELAQRASNWVISDLFGALNRLGVDDWLSLAKLYWYEGAEQLLMSVTGEMWQL